MAWVIGSSAPRSSQGCTTTAIALGCRDFLHSEGELAAREKLRFLNVSLHDLTFHSPKDESEFFTLFRKSEPSDRNSLQNPYRLLTKTAFCLRPRSTFKRTCSVLQASRAERWWGLRSAFHPPTDRWVLIRTYHEPMFSAPLAPGDLLMSKLVTIRVLPPCSSPASQTLNPKISKT